MTSPTTRRTEPWHGFTLVELCVVLVIVGLVLAVVTPRFGAMLTRGTLRSEARRLSAAARHLSGEAARTGKPHYLNIDVGKDAYWVTVDEGRGRPAEPSDPLAAAYVLSEGVRFKDVAVAGRGGRAGGVQRIGFFRRGENDEAVIHLSDNARRRNISVHLKPYGGRTAIHDYYYK